MSGKKTYSGKLKFQVVMELLQGNSSTGQIAKAYGIHPNTVTNWKSHFQQHGHEIFESDRSRNDSDKRIADLEQLLGKKEVEIALLKNFLGRSR
ncbi:MAG: transposase [Candidatus Aegiribacteria sp.]|nr:transposase [Candidatus Aegiribacteria sp.]MBD3295135.1 transposase [Candidatus Fermentibacteria bacterium]